MDTQRDDQKTLEHYTELYVPLQVQQMLIENMNKVLSPA
jgi:hypothetical protein